MHPRPAILWLSVASGLAGCGSGGAPDAGAGAPLVAPERWEPVAAEDDPFAEERPAAVDCPPDVGYYVETFGAGEVLEVDTRACNYLALRQPSMARVEAGQRLDLLLWWADLFSDPPAEAHLAVTLGGEILWEERVGLPGSAEVRDLELTAERAAPAGAPVHFHLHNHDYNTWNFGGLEAD